MLEVILLKVMLEKLLEEANFKSVVTTFSDYQVEIEWDLTMRCNYSCSYCVSYNNEGPTHFQSLEQYKEALEYLKNYLGNKIARIDLLGGEPLLYKDWISLLNIIHDMNFIPKITTNLSIPKKTLESKIKELIPKNCIDVSWHPQFADEKEIVSKIKTINESGHLRSISILGDTRYWDKVLSARKSLDFCEKVKISYIKNEASTKNTIATELIDYTEEQSKTIDDSCKKKLNKQYITKVIYSDGKEKSISNITNFFSNGITNFKGMRCEVGQLRLHIKPTGDVFPSACLLNYSKAKMGNIYKKDLIKPVSSIKCPFSFCGCGPDLRINKYA